MKKKIKKELEWYIQPLSFDEIKMYCKYVIPDEQSPELVSKQLRFMADELDHATH